jgi:hypothetical protein
VYAAKRPIDERTSLTFLRGAHLARSHGGRPIETLEPYHECWCGESVLQVPSQDEQVEIAAEIAATEA